MHIVARVTNGGLDHAVEVSTEGRTRTVSIPAKAGGGFEVNGGELLFAALATCYCNDLYREAAKAGIVIENVDVTVEGDFGAAGEPAKNLRYSVHVESDADPGRVRDLLRYTDSVAEIQKTVRSGCEITFVDPS
jgi:organic hydroperoxide reductase OsmC/OhrA